MRSQHQHAVSFETHIVVLSLILFLLASFLCWPKQAFGATGSDQKCHAIVAHEYEEVKDWYGGVSTSLITDTDLGSNINDQLFRNVGDAFVPGIVESITKDDDTGYVTLNIDRKCKWSSGQSITSSDLKAGFEMVFSVHASDAAPREGVFKNGQAVLNGELPIEELGIEIIDDLTLRFQSELGIQSLQDILSSSYYIPLPNWNTRELEDASFFSKLPTAFSGPYMVTNYDEAGRVELAVNPHFCGKKPFFETAEINPAPNAEDFLVLAGQNKNVVMYVTLSGQDVVKEVMSIDWLEERFEIFEHRQTIIAFMRLNAVNGVFQDQEIRRAFQMAIDWDGDRGADARLTVGEARLPATSLVPEVYFEDTPKYPKDLRPRDERLEEARAILSERGYNDENPLILTAALTIDQTDFFYLTKEMVEEGLPIIINETLIEDIGEYYSTVHLTESTDYDISLARWGTSDPWPMFYIDFYYNNNVNPASLKAAGQPYLDTILRSSDPEKVNQAQIEAVQLLTDQNIFIPFFADGALDLLANNVEKRDNIWNSSIWSLTYKDRSMCEL